MMTMLRWSVLVLACLALAAAANEEAKAELMDLAGASEEGAPASKGAITPDEAAEPVPRGLVTEVLETGQLPPVPEEVDTTTASPSSEASKEASANETEALGETEAPESTSPTPAPPKKPSKKIYCKLASMKQPEIQLEPVAPEAAEEEVPEDQESADTEEEPPAISPENAQVEEDGSEEAPDRPSSPAPVPSAPPPLPLDDVDTDALLAVPSGPSVRVVNGTEFVQLLSELYDANVTNRSTPAQCAVAFFYGSWCPFSAKAAPHFNALARHFPDVQMLAVDSYAHYGLNTQFGIMSLPTVMLFHNGRPMNKFNGTLFNLTHFADYLLAHTNLALEDGAELEVLQEDTEGPVPTEPEPTTDYYLYLSWSFLLAVCMGQFGKSVYCKRIVEVLRNNWQEAEIQHEHQD